MLVRWTGPAADDLAQICDYTLEHFGGPQARRTALTILRTTGLLGAHPHRGRPGRVPGTRELVLPGLPFLIVYRIEAETIEISRVLHGSHRWP